MLDVDFIRGGSNDDYLLPLDDTTPLEILRQIIAGWYVTLRTIAVVGLLSVLIYIGIRIIISSTASDKAKYKQRLIDWVVAFCLLFFMHYIMSATLTVVDKVNDVLGANSHVREGIALPTEYGPVRYNLANETQNVDKISNKIITQLTAWFANKAEYSNMRVTSSDTSFDTGKIYTWNFQANGKRQISVQFDELTENQWSVGRYPEGDITDQEFEEIKLIVNGQGQISDTIPGSDNNSSEGVIEVTPNNRSREHKNSQKFND